MYESTPTSSPLCANVQREDSGERLSLVHLCRCAVCQMEFEAGDEVVTLPCSHFYHPDCIGEWLKDRKVRGGSQLQSC